MRPVRINRWFRKMKGGGMPWSRKRRNHGTLLPVFGVAGLFLLLLLLRFSGIHGPSRPSALSGFERETAIFLWKAWYPAAALKSGTEPEEDLTGQLAGFLLRQVPYYRSAADGAIHTLPGEPDPAYRDYLESSRVLKEYECLVKDLEDSTLLASGGGQAAGGGLFGGPAGGGGSFGGQEAGGGLSGGQNAVIAGAGLISRGRVSDNGIRYVAQQLADYDFLMKHFYTVHPTAAAGRGLMKAEEFLKKDFSLSPAAGPGGAEDSSPQILIYHTHSQEEFSDFHQGNKDATIVGVGNYLTELLTQRGYNVIHDTTVYDLRDGKLDRSRAYTYALDGVTAILQKHPSIQIVLDLHRDGVKEGTHLVTQVNGKPTATIMFFNGTSETPDGPIEYLKNPYRTDNLAFSFQMKLCADACYPGFTRKIYIKGLRYNQHVRPASALIEVGAQTNTYEEARNAMEPLAELLDMVVGSE